MAGDALVKISCKLITIRPTMVSHLVVVVRLCINDPKDF